VSRKLWFKDGKLVTRGGKILLCETCPCDVLSDVCADCGYSPTVNKWDVTIAGVVNGSTGCVSCPNINSTKRFTTTGACQWQSTHSGCGIGYTSIINFTSADGILVSPFGRPSLHLTAGSGASARDIWWIWEKSEWNCTGTNFKAAPSIISEPSEACIWTGASASLVYVP
jgi:hypothetical protein